MTTDPAEHVDRHVWADQLTLGFFPVTDDREPDVDRWVEIEALQFEWSRDWIDNEILRIGTSPDGEPMLWFEEKRSVVSWGADAAILEYVVNLAPELFSAALGYGFGRLADGLEKKIRSRDTTNGGVLHRTEEEITELARLRIATRYESNADQLVVTRIKTQGQEVVVALREPGGLPRYEVAYCGRGNGVSMISCTRIFE